MFQVTCGCFAFSYLWVFSDRILGLREGGFPLLFGGLWRDYWVLLVYLPTPAAFHGKLISGVLFACVPIVSLIAHFSCRLVSLMPYTLYRSVFLFLRLHVMGLSGVFGLFLYVFSILLFV